MYLAMWKHHVRASPRKETVDRLSLLIISIAFGLSACASSNTDTSVKRRDASMGQLSSAAAVTRTTATKEGEPKILFVLLDGTRNDPSSLTNVYAMKQAIDASSFPAVVLYLEGVGSTSDPPLMSSALGLGMEARINQGYRFLSEQYRPGDRIVIMGFSRGAHQARALAGLIAYAGLLDLNGMDERRQAKAANDVIETIKAFSDEETEPEWRKAPDEPPKLAYVSRVLGHGLRAAPVAFLGVWDTVPGSSFKEYGECRELPDGRPGDRYKTGSYPSIARIAHAVALDEQRSMFRPILLCPPLAPGRTKVSEAWFAGAHADVGGGYGQADNSLSRVSLAWMAEQLSVALGAKVSVLSPTEADALAPAHWSMGDAPANFRSHCAKRVVPTDAQMHPSVGTRLRLGMAPLVIKGVTTEVKYPFSCKHATSASLRAQR